MSNKKSRFERSKNVKAEDISKEIKEAEKEIKNLEIDVENLSITLKRSDYIKAESKRLEIRVLKRFINDARAILEARKK